jgi:DNA-directed RNA polymerase subunit RPC12/RpoP
VGASRVGRSQATNEATGVVTAPIACPYCRGRLEEWSDDRVWRCIDCGRLDTGVAPMKAAVRRRLGPPAWWGGASPEEVLVFQVFPYNPGDGTGIRAFDMGELERQAVLAASLIKSGRRSPWLRRWGAQLRDELRRREAA